LTIVDPRCYKFGDTLRNEHCVFCNRPEGLPGMTPTDAAIDPDALAALADEALDWRFKAIPVTAWGKTVGELLAERPHLSDFGTPLLTLDAPALESNLRTMAAYCAEAGVLLAPHGKTTMAPALWSRQLEAGAWGITVANVPQLRVGRAFGVRRLHLANALVDPAALRWISAELDADPSFGFSSWVDSRSTVALMDDALRARGAQRPLDVFVELGALGKRTGAREIDEALDIATAIAATSTLRLVGVAGYEGVVAHEATPEALEAIRAYLHRIAELHSRLLTAGLYRDTDEVFITAGGSAFFDQVVEILGPMSGLGINVLLRSGAYVIHDDGFYSGISPFSRGTDDQRQHPFRSAMHGWARVLSRPEPELVLLDGGKRDFPFDEGLPTPQHTRGKTDDLTTSTFVTALADQHTFMSVDPRVPLAVGDVVRLGLSHPCTALDKWTLIPVLDDASAADPVIVDLIRTYF
jgi:D-serine deaminase-like pyridoxal phosphate-dependent protein